jgi:hypothetical protein
VPAAAIWRGMGKPTRNEQLAERRGRRSRGGIDAEGHVGARDVASVDIDPDRTVYCCERGVHFTLAYRLYEWKRGVWSTRASNTSITSRPGRLHCWKLWLLRAREPKLRFSALRSIFRWLVFAQQS